MAASLQQPRKKDHHVQVGDVEVLIAMTLHALPVAGADVAVEGRPAMENVVGVIELGLDAQQRCPCVQPQR
jgi:hypothetical protein